MAISNEDFIPNDELAFAAWYNNFQVKVVIHQDTLGIADVDTDSVRADYAMLSYLLTINERLRNDSKELNAYKDAIFTGGGAAGAPPVAPVYPAPPATVAPGVIPRLRALVKRIKPAPGYTEAIGQDLGVIRSRPAPVLNPKPRGSVGQLSNSRVEVKFIKAGFAGVLIESRRGSETEWTFLDRALLSPYVDSRAPLVAGQPEVRQYRLIYLKGNDTVGEPTDAMAVATMP